MRWWLGACGVLFAACGGEVPSPPRAAPPPLEAPVPPPPEPPPPAPAEVDLSVGADPAQLREKLLAAERAILDPAVDDELAARWGHAQQRVFRALSEDPALAAAVLDGVEDRTLADQLRRVVHGTAAITRTVRRPRSDLPDWRIERPPPPSELRAAYDAASAAHGVPWTALASIHLHETRMGRLRGVSPAGALGPMQFMPETWARYGQGGDVHSPADAIAGAAHYLSRMGWAKDPRKALWHYNQSQDYVDAVLDLAAWLEAEPRRYRGLWGWQVYYRTVRGSIWLSEGYEQATRVPIEAWCEGKGEPWCPRAPGSR